MRSPPPPATRDRIAAAASFYGTWLVSDAEESPHLTLGKARGELYISCAEHDDLAPLPMVEEPEAAVRRLGRRASWRCIPASTTASPSRSAGATTSLPPSGTGNA
jgi:hypothetical protein